MNTRLLLILLFISITNTSFGQNYQSMWDTVESFEIQGKTTTANKNVLKIAELAKKNQDQEQLIKTTLYLAKFALVLEEDAEVKIVHRLEREIQTAPFPTNAVLQSILADFKWQYFQKNKWRVYRRTATDSIVTNDITTWDINTLFKSIQADHKAALKEAKKLQEIPITNYHYILNRVEETETLRPTLYDFIAWRSLDFFSHDESRITKAKERFHIDNERYFSPSEHFISTSLDHNDSIFSKLQALKTYQQLERFHHKTKNRDALTQIFLRRLHFVSKNVIQINAKEAQRNALKKTYESLAKGGNYALVKAEYAEITYAISTLENHPEYRKEVLAIAQEISKDYPKSNALAKVINLRRKILKPQLSITHEHIVPSGSPSKIRLAYTNIDTVYFNVYRVNHDFNLSNGYYGKRDSIVKAFFKTQKPIHRFSKKLIQKNDYFSHSTEIPVKALAPGKYVMMARTQDIFDPEKLFSWNYITISDLACVESSYNGKYTFQVLNRSTGKPIKNAHVTYGASKKNTNHLGEATFNSKRKNKNVIITKAKDSLLLGKNYRYSYRNSNNNNSKIRVQSYLFLDRSIYRPGQKVFFKGIVISKRENLTSVVSDETFDVIIKDRNYQEIKRLTLRTNDFGSFASNFTLPSDGLTGNFSITIAKPKDFKSFTSRSVSFAVEEYKRPKFEVSFSPITAAYLVNQDIIVKGTAKAFSGVTLDQAKVTYTVKRKTAYARRYFWAPQDQETGQEIVSGEVTTNTEGAFEIVFPAKPDLTKDKKRLPVFTYEITADVTDINGETRSATTSLRVGYHAMNILIKSPKKWNTHNKEQAISISTENLNREAVPAKVAVNIYKLEAPNRVLRTRKLAVADTPLLSKEDFMRLFPNEAFTDENKIANWKDGKLVFSKKIDTKNASEFLVKRFENWESGKYVIRVKGKDKFNLDIEQEQLFTLVKHDDAYLADKQLFDYTILNPTTFVTDEYLEINLKTALKNLPVLIEGYYDNNRIFKNMAYTNGTKTVKIPFKKGQYITRENGYIAVQFSFIRFNEFFKKSKTVYLPSKKKELHFETLVLRDKLQPGQKERWQFKLKNQDSLAIPSEVLASMYDSSLDQFKSHHWQKQIGIANSFSNPIARKTSRRFHVDYFKNKQAKLAFLPLNQNLHYSTLNTFGFGLNGYEAYTYLKSLSSKLYSKDIPKGMIRGIVTDENGLPLPTTVILLKGTNYGVTTDFDGAFNIKATKDDVLQVNMVGYETQEIVVRDFNFIALKLSPDNTLEEVVVTAMGFGKKRKRKGDQRANFKQGFHKNKAEYDTIDNQGNLDRVLNGKASGVRTSQTSGLSGSGTNVIIRGYSSLGNADKALFVIDGVPYSSENSALPFILGEDSDSLAELDPDNIANISILKGIEATTLYGAEGSNGVILITTKNGNFKGSYKAILNHITAQQKIEQDFASVKARKNLNETAFFYPQLRTNPNGEISFEFETPEALTKWKLQLFGHTKTGVSGAATHYTVSQKDLMVIPNAPRFLRENDRIVFQSKIANLTPEELHGFAKLELYDAVSGKVIAQELLDATKQTVPFTIDGSGNTLVAWELHIPEGLQAVQYKVLAKAGDFTDGEESILPVLTNRMLVTESIPFTVRSNTEKQYSFQKLKNPKTTTQKNHQLTLEYTTNPAWPALQSLPYLMEFPHECAEQTFARYYANTLGAYVLNSNPKVKAVFETWEDDGQLTSKLEQNEALKQVLIAETPWVRDAQSEAIRKKRLGLLFNLRKLQSQQHRVFRKLKQLQKNSGGFPWFRGGDENYYITRHIITGFGHLKQLDMVDLENNSKAMIEKAVRYIDTEFQKRHHHRLQYRKENEIYVSNSDIHYLYARSFYKKEFVLDKKATRVFDLYKKLMKTDWLERSLYEKLLIALVSSRYGDQVFAKTVLEHLKETAITVEDKGMYWKTNVSGWYWYQAPIETQALAIEAFAEITEDQKTIEELQIWLINNKRKNDWNTTKATTDAVYALLLQGKDWLSIDGAASITVGTEIINTAELNATQTEAGTGYFKRSWPADEITSDMADITIKNTSDVIQFGGYYWQYFENMDQITSANTTGDIQLKKQLFLKDNGVLKAIATNTLNVGDLLTIRIELQVKDNFEFVHLKDMRASAFEPIDVLSQYKWQDNTGYYQSTKDVATHFFFDRLNKGTYVLEYDVRVNNSGDFSNGIATIQSMYAPEFSSHSEGIRVTVKE